MGISVLLSCGRKVSSYQAGKVRREVWLSQSSPLTPGLAFQRSARLKKHLPNISADSTSDYIKFCLFHHHTLLTFNQFDPNAQKNSTSSSNIEQIMLKLHFRKADYTVSTAFLFKLLQLQKWQSCILMIRKRFAACRGISDLVETTCIAFW